MMLIRTIKKQLLNIRIAILHAAYHRNLKKATLAKIKKNLVDFQKCIYKSEDAWRKLVRLTTKQNLYK
jgi:hypothetical protein